MRLTTSTINTKYIPPLNRCDWQNKDRPQSPIFYHRRLTQVNLTATHVLSFTSTQTHIRGLWVPGLWRHLLCWPNSLSHIRMIQKAGACVGKGGGGGSNRRYGERPEFEWTRWAIIIIISWETHFIFGTSRHSFCTSRTGPLSLQFWKWTKAGGGKKMHERVKDGRLSSFPLN